MGRVCRILCYIFHHRSRKGCWRVAMKVYIAGPMTGLPQFNVPLFDHVARQLRKQGYDVVSPAELDSPEMRAAAMKSKDGSLAPLEQATGETWGHVLARDVLVLSDFGIEGIVLLPNWWQSRGASLETTVGLLNKLKFFYWQSEEEVPTPLATASVLSGLIDGYAHRGTV
jgi:uncharacterized protein DUF4406